MTTDDLNLIISLTGDALPPSERRIALDRFSRQNGWLPSDELEYAPTNRFANAHIIVEHGLEHSVVLSFLKRGMFFSQLSENDQHALLRISYNNLIEWHFLPHQEGITIVYNRSNPAQVTNVWSHQDEHAWRADAFDRLVGRKPSPNVTSLDNALIGTLQQWKIRLKGELGNRIDTVSISALFNAILLVRALEDYRNQGGISSTPLLIDIWYKRSNSERTVRKCIDTAMKKLLSKQPPRWLSDPTYLDRFSALDSTLVYQLFRDFYSHRLVPYGYDFSLMSKHALSRIYEHYVSLLAEHESDQYSMFPQVPEEIADYSLGGVYTPQYVARFFARCLRTFLSLKEFKAMKIVDPACGSGIFPRTIIEMQCDPWLGAAQRQAPNKALENLLAVDIDPNACQATNLSLALLHLVLDGNLPKKTPVIQAEALNYYRMHSDLREKFDVAVTNPPFIMWEKLPDELKRQIKHIMGSEEPGKVDASTAFLKLGMDLIKPGGYLLFVLPYSFMVTAGAKATRQEISEKYFVRFLADLSQITVFEKIGAYVILLVLQKRDEATTKSPNAVVVRCKEFVGHALQDGLDKAWTENDSYSVFEVEQDVFAESEWRVIPPTKQSIRNKVSAGVPLIELLEIREGVITGADNIFIRQKNQIPSGESKVYRPYLSDREILRFRVPNQTERVMLYPYVDGRMISQDEMAVKFPSTWRYIEENEDFLKSRKALKVNPSAWWRPLWMRSPEELFRPKIVTPHLILSPKFGFDKKGVFLVSRCPFLYLKDDIGDQDILKYLLAILNSSVMHWQLSTSAHRFGRGYLKLEKLVLRRLSVPDPSALDTQELREVYRMTDLLTSGSFDPDVFSQLDRLVARLYGIRNDELIHFGIE